MKEGGRREQSKGDMIKEERSERNNINDFKDERKGVRNHQMWEASRSWKREEIELFSETSRMKHNSTNTWILDQQDLCQVLNLQNCKIIVFYCFKLVNLW